MTRSDTGTGKRRTLIIIGLIIFIIAAAGFVWVLFQFDRIAKESERHDYSYSLTLSISSVIENVTFLLPVPELNGTVSLADMVANGTGYGVPEDWHIAIETVDGIPFLQVRAARMVPEYHSIPIPVEPGAQPSGTPPPTATGYSEETPVLLPVEIGATLETEVPVDTRDPIGREPLFSQGGEYAPRLKTTPPYEGMEYTHPVRLYLSYTADNPVPVSIVARVSGTNSIWRGGWTFNSYRDQVLVEAGDRTGWIETDAVLVVGEGTYW
ncbi:MAG: hypothetical protein BWY93_01675 [Euryarchaeota archaeon ADurb.BinA087]|nr:MAG: hypothetical protein BWY93_01675 [Euryarchaeota archaeon ADurb.BinA087]HNQ26049.1 hypothetical protein [Methanoregulaceae archaeon]